MRRTIVVTLLLVATAARTATAQTSYSIGRDTLRFHEVTHGKIQLIGPQGEIPMKQEHEATVAVVRAAGDTTRAWFEALSIAMSGPMGDQKPATDAALRAPFVFRMDPRGRLTPVSTPTFPPAFDGVAELTHQFDDFFLRLPAKPLAVGLTWSDSLTRTDSTADKYARWHSLATYRVERDTMVDGVAAVVVSMKQQIDLNGDSPVRNQDMRVHSALAGSEDGYFVFAPRTGRLLARRRSGQLGGDLLLHGANEMAFKQSYEYTSQTDAIK
jgi:hypothetical protein